MDAERKSITDLIEGKTNDLFDRFSKVERVETAAIITSIREMVLEGRANKMPLRELIERCVDLSEPLLYDDYLYNPESTSHGVDSIWRLVTNGDLKLNPDRTFACVTQFKEELLSTLPAVEI